VGVALGDLNQNPAKVCLPAGKSPKDKYTDQKLLRLLNCFIVNLKQSNDKARQASKQYNNEQNI